MMGEWMAVIHEPARDIPVVEECDLVVVGGSCTGVFAAVRAARLGLKVSIVEKQNCFGGMATAGNVSIWHKLYNVANDQQIIGGLTQEVIDRLKKRRAVYTRGATNRFELNTEELKIELDELVSESRITPYLNTMYSSCVSDNGELKAVIIENKDGRTAIRGRWFVDATGDADVARHLGVPLHSPQPLQPPTLCAKMYGMDSLGEFDWQQAVREHGAEFGLEPDWGWGHAVPGIPGLQMRADNHIFGVDVSDAQQLTRGEIEGRRRVRALMDLIRKYGPETSEIVLADLAAALGARETRRIQAVYQLTGEDVLYGRRFDDAIANGCYPVDTHHSDGAGITFKFLDGTQQVIRERGLEPEKGRWRDTIDRDPTFYQIPYRCLVTEKTPNLIMAGRMLDADKTAFSAVRVMVNLNQTGEAAGVGAYLGIQDGCAAADLNPQRLRKTLADGGSVIL
mgnify:CR=1 FL=1